MGKQSGVQDVRRTGTGPHLLNRQHKCVVGGLPRKAQQLQRGDAALQAAHARLERRVAQADAPELLLAGVLRRRLQRLRLVLWNDAVQALYQLFRRPALALQGAFKTLRCSCACTQSSRCWSCATPGAGGTKRVKAGRINAAAQQPAALGRPRAYKAALLKADALLSIPRPHSRLPGSTCLRASLASPPTCRIMCVAATNVPCQTQTVKPRERACATLPTYFSSVLQHVFRRASSAACRFFMSTWAAQSTSSQPQRGVTVLRGRLLATEHIHFAPLSAIIAAHMLVLTKQGC